jgi:RHS repeat-associated protein
MIEDLNKGIDLITYNHLNLPNHIYFANNGTAGRRIGYVYTADGIKLRKYTHLNTNAEGPVTDYVGAFVYENNELQFIQTSEGRLVPDGNGGYDYEYALKDHLGNTRVMFSQTGEVLQDQSYYPFGMIMGEALTFDMPSNLPDNKYLYNGKELQMDFDLGWYDYGARFYDPQIGRWHVIDPMYARHYDWTPYAYVLNNPIINIDLYGFTDWKAIMKGSAMVVGGLTSVIGGVAAASTPTGVGQYAGGAAIVTGVPTMGVGIGMIVAGIKDDGTAEKVPTGPGETAGMAGDKLMGNENNELRNAGSALDLGINIATANPQTVVEEVALGVDVAISVDGIVNNDNNNSGTDANSEQITQSVSNSENGNGIDLVLGQHLKSSDPDYWNSLTKEQQTGYNQDRTDRYKQHLIDDNK